MTQASYSGLPQVQTPNFLRPSPPPSRGTLPRTPGSTHQEPRGPAPVGSERGSRAPSAPQSTPYLSSICCKAWSGIFRGAGALGAPQRTLLVPGPGTIALRGGGVGLSPAAAADPPPSLPGRLREAGGSGARPAGVRRRWWAARRRSLGRGGGDRGPSSCPSARGSGPWTAGAELLPAEELPL